MKKIIPFEKEIFFKTNVSDIISIDLNHELDIKDYNIEGEFKLKGEYKILSESVNVEKFNYDLPFAVSIDEKYDVANAVIDIDDFYYEIKNDNVLKINIDVLIDNIEEKPLYEKERYEKQEELILEEPEIVEPVEFKRCVEEESELSKQKNTYNIFNINDDETYKSYTVYIMRENDTIDEIIKKYVVSKELLEQYNDLSEVKIGDKIIIP